MENFSRISRHVDMNQAVGKLASWIKLWGDSINSLI